MTRISKTNGTHGHRTGVPPINRIPKARNVEQDVHDEPAASAKRSAVNGDKPEPKTEGKMTKALLGLGAAVVAVVAAEYALRKFTKTGGIIPHLLRLEKWSSAYMATVEKP